MAEGVLTEDDVRRIVREEIERSRVVPFYTTPQPIPVPPGWPLYGVTSGCPNGCRVGTVCMNAACPMRVQIT